MSNLFKISEIELIKGSIEAYRGLIDAYKEHGSIALSIEIITKTRDSLILDLAELETRKNEL